MTLWNLATVAQHLGARLTGGDSVIPNSLSLDTRSIEPGDCFVAIRAERDGHEFVAMAVEKGASALLVDHAMDVAVSQLVVPDTLAAMQRWGQARLESCRPDVVFGITGSVGKTTTKELLAAATSAWKTPGNRNNTFGVPQALATLPEDISAVVLEMGMSTPGEIQRLTEIAPPDAGIITMIGTAHMENFPEGQEGIARAKGELVAGLREGGFWCHLSKDPWCGWIARQPWASRARAVPVGEDAEYGWENVRSLGVQGEAFTFRMPSERVEARLKLRGSHHISNAVLAAACALESGFSLEQILAGMESVEPEPGRGRLHALKQGGRLLDESYNASPDSVLACAKALLELEGDESVAVLGCMRELGAGSADIHQVTGAALRSLGLSRVLVFGDFAVDLATAFGPHASAFPDYDAMLADPDGLGSISSGARILVKGSRYWKSERAVDWLLASLGSESESLLREG